MRVVKRFLVLLLSVLVLSSGSPVQGLALAGSGEAGRIVLAAQTTQGSEREGTEKKRLLRDTKNAKIGGVCAGIANYFDLDPTLVRLGWVLFVLMGGAGILGYIVCWIVIPAA